MSLLKVPSGGRIFRAAMMYSDLHCDSITKAFRENVSITDSRLAVKLGSDNFIKREQCFALWLSDELHGEAAFCYAEKLLQFYKEKEDKIKSVGVIPHLTIENASALGGNLDNIAYFREQGTVMMSLTWNGENDLAGGADAVGGLKTKGEEALREMENCGIIPDVSHLNEEGFRDVCRIATKPFVASHSNCYDICPHRRNLKRWQIKEIIDRGGLIGINFYPPFLGEGSVLERVRDNIEYIISLGGENCIALGSDFDGAKMSRELKTANDVVKLRDYLLASGMSGEVVEKIFYGNASCNSLNFNI